MLIFLLHIFVVYVFCWGIYLCYYFFSNKLLVWIYDFVHVMVCFRFYKIVFVCKLLKLMSNYRFRCVVMMVCLTRSFYILLILLPSCNFRKCVQIYMYIDN
jgi:hypothetical protein